MNELRTEDAIEILLSEKKKADVNTAKAYDSYCLFPNEHDQKDWDDYSALSDALDMAIEALRRGCGGVKREKIPAKCQNCSYMRAWSIRMDGNHEYDCRKKPRSMVGNPDCEQFEKREPEDE